MRIVQLLVLMLFTSGVDSWKSLFANSLLYIFSELVLRIVTKILSNTLFLLIYLLFRNFADLSKKEE